MLGGLGRLALGNRLVQSLSKAAICNARKRELFMESQKEGGGKLSFPASRKTEMTKNQMRCDSDQFAGPVLGRRLASMLSL